MWPERDRYNFHLAEMEFVRARFLMRWDLVMDRAGQSWCFIRWIDEASYNFDL